MNSYQKRKQELQLFIDRSKALEQLINEILEALKNQEKFDTPVDRVDIYQRLAQINTTQPMVRAEKWWNGVFKDSPI